MRRLPVTADSIFCERDVSTGSSWRDGILSCRWPSGLCERLSADGEPAGLEIDILRPARAADGVVGMCFVLSYRRTPCEHVARGTVEPDVWRRNRCSHRGSFGR